MLGETLITDLVQIRALAEAKESENLDFRRYLTVHAPPPHVFAGIAAAVALQIDCTECANCCRQTSVDVTQEEIEAIARHLSTTAAEVTRQYTDGGKTLRQNASECVFLDGNLCMIYEARPGACRDFPHLSFEHASLGGRMSSIERNAWLCPIVYNAVEAYKKALGFPKCHASAHG